MKNCTTRIENTCSFLRSHSILASRGGGGAVEHQGVDVRVLLHELPDHARVAHVARRVQRRRAVVLTKRELSGATRPGVAQEHN